MRALEVVLANDEFMDECTEVAIERNAEWLDLLHKVSAHGHARSQLVHQWRKCVGSSK